MERTARAKADHVVCWRQGKKIIGTLHMMPHHLIFRYQWPQVNDKTESDATPSETQPAYDKSIKETWIGYALIGFCTYRPSPPASHLPPQIRIRCRDFAFFAFHFDNDVQAREVYDTVRTSTCKIDHVSQVLAYSYSSNAERAFNGWNLYDPKKEFARMGISEKNRDKGWRITTINNNYTYSPTYPAVLCVPSNISDNTLKHTASFRSKARIPVLTYLHPLNECTITRSAQPSAGIRGTRSPQDEKLVNAIFRTTRPSTANAALSTSASQSTQSSSDLSAMVQETSDAIDAIEISPAEARSLHQTIVDVPITEDSPTQIVQIYGAQQTNMIVDARPNLNAMANQALGYGSENMEGYPSARKLFLGIDNIHVMRKSLEDVTEALKDSDLTTLPPLYAKLEKSLWRDRISKILSGALTISNTIAVQHSHVLIHCSDGWDRTSQLSALSQICLDPFYRTLEGFMILVEKDFVSFGHMFRLRAGLLHHEKWFEIENERANLNRNVTQSADVDAHDGAGNAFENALAKAQGFFRRKLETKDEDRVEGMLGESSPSRGGSPRKDERMATKPKEISPIFHQFLDATYQLLRQYPSRFEFNERFLRRLFYHLYSCQYGNFLFNSEKELAEAKAKQKTHSVWGYFLAKRQQFLNDQYDATIDENDKERSSLIQPDPHNIKWWHELFGRSEKEMDGPLLTANIHSRAAIEANASIERLETSTESESHDASSSRSSQFGTMTVDAYPSFSSGGSNYKFARMDERPSQAQQVLQQQQKPNQNLAGAAWLNSDAVSFLAEPKNPLDVEMQ